jgi:hypothetical protein
MIKLGKPRKVGLRLLYSESQTGFYSIYLFQTNEVLVLSSITVWYIFIYIKIRHYKPPRLLRGSGKELDACYLYLYWLLQL